MPFFSMPDANLYYEAHGQGAPVVLISGLGGGTSTWYGQVPFFQRHYRTITMDNRGSGRSDMPEGPYAMRRMAEDVLCLLDHLAVPEVFALGLSMGGMIAQELALLAPRRVRALVLCCTHFGGERRVPPPPHVMSLLVDNAGFSQEEIFERQLPLFFSQACLRSRPDFLRVYRDVQLSTSLQPDHAFHAQLAAIRTFDARERLSSLRMPTLVVAAGEDALVPEVNGQSLARCIPGAKIVVVPGVGHAVHVEWRDGLNELVHAFFQRHCEA